MEQDKDKDTDPTQPYCAVKEIRLNMCAKNILLKSGLCSFSPQNCSKVNMKKARY